MLQISIIWFPVNLGMAFSVGCWESYEVFDEGDLKSTDIFSGHRVS